MTTKIITKKGLVLFIIANLLVLALSAQRTSYIITSDTVTTFGARLIDGGSIANAQVCQVLIGKDTIRYTPDELLEYGFRNGQVYVSKEITFKGEVYRVFLERITEGKATLYFYRHPEASTFFMKKNDLPLTEIPYRDEQWMLFSRKLDELTSDCKNLSLAIKRVSYNRNSMRTFIDRYNNCVVRPFPFTKFGISAGIGASRLSPSKAQQHDLINLFEFEYDRNFVFGVFADFNIAQSDFSLYTELNFFRHSYDYKADDLAGDNFVVQRISFNNTKTMLLLPLMARYAYPSNQIRPYVNAGLQFSYTLKNTNSFMERERGTGIPLHTLPVTLPHPGFGYVWGAGVELQLSSRRSLFVEFRHGKLFSIYDWDSLREKTAGLYFGVNY